MSRVQLALNVADLDAAVEFYSKLFATEPAKVRPGYANFAIADPPLKLVLIEDAAAGPARSTIWASRSRPPTRYRRPGPPGRRGLPGGRGETTCCYAVQDKVWVDGPDGEPWEIYTVLADAEAPDGQTAVGCSERGRLLCRPPDLAATGSASARPAAERTGRMRDGSEVVAALLAELLGSALLAAVVIGSGIAAQRLSPGNIGLELFENAAATAAGLYALILDVRPGLGRPFQPGDLLRGRRLRRDRLARRPGLPARPGRRVRRRGGAGEPDVLPGGGTISTKHRATGAHFLSEVVATLGLLLVIFALARTGQGHHAAPRRRGVHRRRLLLHLARPASPTRPSPSGACSPTPSPASLPPPPPVFIAAQIVGGLALGRHRPCTPVWPSRPPTWSCPTARHRTAPPSTAPEASHDFR